jgi:hypothetical protein
MSEDPDANAIRRTVLDTIAEHNRDSNTRLFGIDTKLAEDIASAVQLPSAPGSWRVPTGGSPVQVRLATAW